MPFPYTFEFYFDSEQFIIWLLSDIRQMYVITPEIRQQYEILEDIH